MENTQEKTEKISAQELAEMGLKVALSKNGILASGIEYALDTILKMSEGKSIRDLDERIAYLKGLIK